MALIIRNAEIERLAAEAARLAHESKTEAIRKALADRVFRLRTNQRRTRDQRIDAALAQFRVEFPRGDFGRRIAKTEEEEILGFGPDGM